jgi:NAD(P)-dependent dehydrogenase (short-subunit alcohol dehydrogenase family)
MMEGDGGSIINVSSSGAIVPLPQVVAYAGAKAALNAMTRSMARELGPDRITVNAIAPGLVQVEATQYVPQQRHRQYVEQRALQRDQQPEDVTGAVVWLQSPLARFFTGQLLAVNGGFVMH